MGFFTIVTVGLVAGLLARHVVLGPSGMGIPATLLLGIGGSFVGGFVGWLLSSGGRFAELQPTGIVFSTLGAMLLLLVVSRIGARRSGAASSN